MKLEELTFGQLCKRDKVLADEQERINSMIGCSSPEELDSLESALNWCEKTRQEINERMKYLMFSQEQYIIK